MTTLHHRQRNSALKSNYVVLWAEDEASVESYGPVHCTVDDSLCTLDLRDPAVVAQVLADAIDDDMSPFYGVESLGEHEINPSNIVESAGAWDTPEFASWFWDRYEVGFVRTDDGAVLLNWTEVDHSQVTVEE